MTYAVIRYPNGGRYQRRGVNGEAWEDRCFAGGRNGYANCTAVSVMFDGRSSVALCPVNSRDMTLAGAMLDLPPDPATLRTVARWLEAAACELEAGGGR